MIQAGNPGEGMIDALDGEWTLKAVVPKGGGECLEYEIAADPKDTGEKLKDRIEKMCKVPSEDQELFAKNSDPGAKQVWLNLDETLAKQNVQNGATILVGVHGMGGGAPPADGAEVPTDAVNTSIYSKGVASYYHAHANQGELTEEQRIVSGGPPAKIAETEEVTPMLPPNIRAPADLCQVSGDATIPRRPEKMMVNYAWGDEKEVIKVYVGVENEREGVMAAGDGKSGEVDVQWMPKSFKLIIHGVDLDHVLILDRIYYEIVPEESKWRVSQNKRITLSLKKKEIHTWLKLLKPA